jgi:hypothetical protein
MVGALARQAGGQVEQEEPGSAGRAAEAHSRGAGIGMRQRTLQASTVAFLLGLVISLVWSYLQASGL